MLLRTTLLLAALLLAGGGLLPAAALGDPRPNILWLTCEDMGPHIGPYGDGYATTPHLDRLAARSLRYDIVWSNAPVCAPARTTLISGVYPTATGSEHMRSWVKVPPSLRMYPEYLREAGYYCTNNVKEDYNLDLGRKVWDDSSNRAHWRGRPAGKPFFAVFNSTVTHESQMRARPHALVHDPAGARVPEYHPDTPEVRRDWAQYYDNITTMDAEVGRRLQELEADGLAENTVVFFYSDHGSGMPRNKRSPCDSGLRVPLLIHFPEKLRKLAPAEYRPGGTTSRPVSFVDFAATVLSLAGIRAPGYYQGQAFLGPHATPPRTTVYGFRGRMDERYDLQRSAREGRWVYVRNFMPHRLAGQHNAYMFQTPTTRVWRRLFDEGNLNAAQAQFWRPKAPEELYDLASDPDEVRNLAGDPAHRETLERLRAALRREMLQTRDVDLLPEADMHARAAGSTPYDLGQAADFPLERILNAADAATRPRQGDERRLRDLLRDPDSGVRYWAATGFLVRGKSAPALVSALEDASPSVRIPAAEAVVRHGSPAEVKRALDVLGRLASPEANPYWVAIQALNAIDELDRKAAPLLPVVRPLGKPSATAHPRTREYPARLVEKILADLEAES